MLVHSDNTVSVIPDTAQAYSAVDVHTLDKKLGEFHSLRVSRRAGSEVQPGFDPFEMVIVGSMVFDPSTSSGDDCECGNPLRGEVIQSPSIVVGDDALLLKYLNPHLIVIVTEAT